MKHIDIGIDIDIDVDIDIDIDIDVNHCIVVAAETSSAIRSHMWCKLTSLLFHVG